MCVCVCVCLISSWCHRSVATLASRQRSWSWPWASGLSYSTLALSSSCHTHTHTHTHKHTHAQSQLLHSLSYHYSPFLDVLLALELQLRSKHLPPTIALQYVASACELYKCIRFRECMLARISVCLFLLTWLPVGRFSSHFQQVRWPCRCSLRCLRTTSGWCGVNLPSLTLAHQSTRSEAWFLSSMHIWGE